MSSRVALSCLLLLVLTAPVAGARSRPVPVPDTLRVPQEHVVSFETQATGVQVYACKAKDDDPTAFAWTVKAPVAELQNDQGEKVGTHFAGPTWEANDGSIVVGDVVGRADAPEPGAIPWLLLRATSNAGPGVLAPVTYVQRLETVGGVAPTEGCDRSAADSELDVEYTATYVFYVWRYDVM